MKGKLLTASLLLAASALATAADAPGSGPAPQMMDPAARFNMMDANKDGKLSLEEFQAMRSRMGGGGGGGQGGPPGGPPPGAPPAGMTPPAGAAGGAMRMSPEERFKEMDTNKDGSVSLAEFQSSMDKMRQMMGPGGQPPASPPPAK